MKTVYAIILTLALQFIFAAAGVKAQTVAIGHVSCEIVESVSVASQAITGFELSAKSTGTSETVKLGEMKISSGNDIACNVVMRAATVSSSNGGSFTIEPSATGKTLTDTQRTIGDQTIQLTGKVNLTQGQSSGLYKGSYSILLAYN